MSNRGTLSVAVLMAASLWACGDAGDASPPTPPPPPVPADTPPPPPVTFHVASFFQNTLSSCVSVALPAGTNEEAVGPVRDAMTSDENARAIAQPCEAQFADRTAWATCVSEIPAREATDERPAFAGATLTEFWYSFAAVYDNDAMMQECMERGRWTARPRDTPQWHRAFRAQRQRDISGLLDEHREASRRLRRR